MSDTITVEPLAKTKSVAQYIGVSEQRLANMRMEGTGPEFIRLGRAIRYKWSAVEAWVNEHTHTSTDEYTDQPGTTNRKQTAA